MKKSTVLITSIMTVVFIAIIIYESLTLARTRIDTTEVPYTGSLNAQIQVVAFIDDTCKPCGNYKAHIFPLIEKNYIETDLIKYYKVSLDPDGPNYEKNYKMAVKTLGEPVQIPAVYINGIKAKNVSYRTLSEMMDSELNS